MIKTNQEKVLLLMKSLETIDPEALSYIHPNLKIHRPELPTGKDGSFFTLENNVTVKTQRSFTDDNIVIIHNRVQSTVGDPTIISIDIFSFKDGMITNYWDNMNLEAEKSLNANTQDGGASEVTDLNKTESNRALVSKFKKEVYLDGNISAVDVYVNKENFVQHSPLLADGTEAIKDSLKNAPIKYMTLKKVFAEGSFILTICDGLLDGQDATFFDLYRAEDDLIVEHWKVAKIIAPKEQWQNENGRTNFNY